MGVEAFLKVRYKFIISHSGRAGSYLLFKDPKIRQSKADLLKNVEDLKWPWACPDLDRSLRLPKPKGYQATPQAPWQDFKGFKMLYLLS